MTLVTDYLPKAVRTAAILTNSYVAGTDLTAITRFNQMVILIDLTLGSLTSAELKVEFSSNGTDFFQETSSAIAGGIDSVTPLAHQMSTTGLQTLNIPILANHIRISIKGTGTVTGSSAAIVATLGVN